MTDSSTQQAVDTIDLTAEPEDPPAPSQPEQRPKRTRTHLLLDDEDDTDAALPSTSRSASHQVNPCRKAQCAQQKEDLSSAQRSAPAELQEHNQLQRSLQSNLDAVNGLREYACNPELQADSSAPVDDDIQIIADDGAEEDHNLAQHDSHGTVNDHAGCTDDPTPLTADERNDNDDPSGDTISIKLRTRLDGEERYETCLIGMHTKLRMAHRTLMRKDLGSELKQRLKREPELRFEDELLSLDSTPAESELEHDDMIELV